MKELSQHEQILNRWESIIAGTTGKPAARQVVKQAVSRSMLNLRSIVP